MFAVVLVFFLVTETFSLGQSHLPSHLNVGVIVAPPMCIKTSNNQWQGFGVELWQVVAQEIGVTYEFHEFITIDSLLGALEKHEIDVIPFVVVHERFLNRMEFSQSYLKSGLAIAVPVEEVRYKWIRILRGLFSWESLKAIGVLLLMSLIAGFIVCLLERRQNSEIFGGRITTGIGHGIWWAMVTMTTVGYGDLTPRTWGGRCVAIIWMIFSLVFIAAFTANITMSLTVQELQSRVRGFDDLVYARVGAIPASEAFDFLNKQGISSIRFDNHESWFAIIGG